MVRARFKFLAVMAFPCLLGCNMTEVAYGHENPLDTIYDNGGYRMVVTGTQNSPTVTTLNWGSVYYTDSAGKKSEYTSSSSGSFKYTATLLYSTAAPTAAELTTIKAGGNLETAPTSYSALTSFTTVGSGSYAVQSPKNTGSYVLKLDYSNSSGSGRFYSNVVVIQ